MSAITPQNPYIFYAPTQPESEDSEMNDVPQGEVSFSNETDLINFLNASLGSLCLVGKPSEPQPGELELNNDGLFTSTCVDDELLLDILELNQMSSKQLLSNQKALSPEIIQSMQDQFRNMESNHREKFFKILDMLPQITKDFFLKSIAAQTLHPAPNNRA